MGLCGKTAKALVIIVITQIACRHCMPRTPRKSALLNNLNSAKNNPLSTPFSPARTDKTPKQTFGKTNQNARINKNSFPKQSIFKKHNFPENDFPLDTTPRDPFHLKTNFNTNYQANRPRASSLRNTQSSIINELKKERKMKRKLQSNAQLINDINEPTKEIIPTTFQSASVNTLLDPKAFPDIQYPLNTMETWEPMYWNSFSLAPPKPSDGLETPRYKTTINENVKNPMTRLTKTKARQFLKSYDKLKDESKRTSTNNSKRSNTGQSGSNFKKIATCEKVSDDFITASLQENVTQKSPRSNISVESSSGEAPSSNTQDSCPISEIPVSEGFTKINRSESEIKSSKNSLKYSKISLLAETLAAIEEILNSDENICEISEELMNTTCYTTMNETISSETVELVEVVENIGSNQPTNNTDEVSVAMADIPIVEPNNISSLLEEINDKKPTMFNVETQVPTSGALMEVAFIDKPSQSPSNQAAPAPTSIIIIPINNNAVGQAQSHMIDNTGNAPIIVYIPSAQSGDVPSQTVFCQQNICQASLDKIVPNNELINGLSNMAPLLNDNPTSTALVSELLNDISNSESSLPIREPLPINSMCYNNESSHSSIKEKPFLNNSTHKSVTNIKPVVNSTCNEKPPDDEPADIQCDVNTEKTLLQMLDSEHPIFDFAGSYVTSLNHGPYNNIIDNELPILPREIDSSKEFVNTLSEHPFSDIPRALGEPSGTFVPLDNLQGQRYKTLPPIAYSVTNYNIQSSFEVEAPSLLDESKPYLVNNLVASIPNTVLTHDNIDATTNDMKDLPFKMGILLPDISELPEDESILYEGSKFVHSQETTNLDIPNIGLPINDFKNLTLSHPINKFDKTSLTEVLKVDNVPNGTPKVLIRPLVLAVPEDELILEATKPIESDIKIEVIKEPVVVESEAFKNKIEHRHEKLNHSLSPYRKEYSLVNATGPSLNDYSSDDNSSDDKDPRREALAPLENNGNQVMTAVMDSTHSIASSSVFKDIFNDDVNPSLSTDKSSLTSKLLVTKALSNNVLADINNTYTTEIVSPTANSIPLFSSLNNTDMAVEITPSESPLLECSLMKNQFSACNINSSLSSANTPNVVNGSKTGSSSTLLDIEPVTNIDESDSNNNNIITNDLENFTLSEDMCPLIPTSGYFASKEQVNNGTIQTEPYHDLTKSVDEVDNASFPKISNVPLEIVVPDRLLLINEPSNHAGIKTTIPQVDENLYNSQKPEQTNYPFTEKFKDITLPILDTPIDPTIIEKDETKQLNLHSQYNVPIFTTVDDSPAITVTKDLLESVLSDIFTKRLAFPLTQTHFEATPSVSERIPHSLGFFDTTTEDSLFGQLQDSTPPITVGDISGFEEKTATIANTDNILETVENELPVTKLNIVTIPSVLEKPTSDSPNINRTNKNFLIQVDKNSCSMILDNDHDTKVLKTAEEKNPDKGINSLVIPEDETLSQTFNNDRNVKGYSISEDYTNEPSLKEKKICDNTPEHDTESLKPNVPSSSSSEITITKELLESVLTDVSRKELLLPRAPNPHDITTLMFNNSPDDKESSIVKSTNENYLKENSGITFNTSLVDTSSNLTDNVLRPDMCIDQPNIQTIDKIPNKDNNLLSVDHSDERPMAVKEIIPTFDDKISIKISTTTKLVLGNVSEVKSADIPDDILTDSPLEAVDKKIFDNPIHQENIETFDKKEDESSIINDKTLPLDEIIISEDDIISPKSPSELKITKALLENILMDIIKRGHSVPVERRINVASDDGIISNESPLQVQEVPLISRTDQSNDNLAVLKEIKNNLASAKSDTTLDETRSKTPKELAKIDDEEKNGDEIECYKNIYGNGIPVIVNKSYSPSKLTITKALLENVLTDIITKGLLSPKEKPSSVTSPSVLDKTLYYTETSISDSSHETPLIQVEEIPLDTSLVGHTNTDSTHTENSEESLQFPTDKTISDIPSIKNPTGLNTEVSNKDQNQTLTLEDFNHDLSPLNEGISEPKTVPVASRSALDKTLYFIDSTLPNVREQTTSEPVGKILKIATENSYLSEEDIDNSLEVTSDETTQNNPNTQAFSEEVSEEKILERDLENLSNDKEEETSLNISDDLSLEEDILDVIKEITRPPAPKFKRVLYSKLSSTKALLEKVLFDITDIGILG